MKNILMIDLMNLFVKTSYVCNYDTQEHLYYLLNFFRSIYQAKNYDIVYIVLEGSNELNKTRLKTYKAGRLKKEGILDNMRVLISIISKYFKVIRNKDAEGDFVLAKVAMDLKAKGNDVTILSNDKDFLQLVQYGIKVADKVSRGKAEVLSDETILLKFKNSKKEPLDKLENILKYRVFKGDTSDKIPSAVNGLQDRHIREIINLWEGNELTNKTLNDMINNVKDEKIKNKLINNKANIIRNYEMMNLADLGDEILTNTKCIKQPVNGREISKWKIQDWQMTW